MEILRKAFCLLVIATLCACAGPKTERAQRIDAFCRFRSVSCLVLFHCRPLNGNEKIIVLCVLCLPRSSRRWYWGASSEAPVITGTSGR